ncbi:hypothetical protein ACOME3_005793 [Neoechinorhynchus agilis]
MSNLAEELENLAKKSLLSFQYDNAVFYGELLRAQNYASEKYTTELADIYLRCNRPEKAYETLVIFPVEIKSDRARLIYAQCCLALNRNDDFNNQMISWTSRLIGTTKADGIDRIDKLFEEMMTRDVAHRPLDVSTIAAFFEAAGHIYLNQSNEYVARHCFQKSYDIVPSSLSCIKSLLEHTEDREVYYGFDLRTKQSNKRSASFGTKTSPATKKLCKRDTMNVPQNEDSHTSSIEKFGVNEIMQIYTRAYRYFCRYECQKVLDELDKLDIHLNRVHSILLLKAFAFFEVARYDKAQAIFEKIRNEYPLSIDGFDYYSSTLWYINDQILEYVREKHEDTWCVAGNSMSSLNDHEAAVRMFKRAAKLDTGDNKKTKMYALTLITSEYIYLQRYSQARKLLRTLIMLDRRNYRAFFNYGLISFYQQIYSAAVANFRSAMELKPTDVYLVCQTGVSEFAAGDPVRALELFDQALKIKEIFLFYKEKYLIDPTNEVCKFHKAAVNMCIGRLDQTFALLTPLLKKNKDSKLYHYLMAKAYMAKGDGTMSAFHQQNGISMANDPVVYRALEQLYSVNNIARGFQRTLEEKDGSANQVKIVRHFY